MIEPENDALRRVGNADVLARLDDIARAGALRLMIAADFADA